MILKSKFIYNSSNVVQIYDIIKILLELWFYLKEKTALEGIICDVYSAPVKERMSLTHCFPALSCIIYLKVTIGSINGLVTDGTMALPELMVTLLTYYWCYSEGHTSFFMLIPLTITITMYLKITFLWWKSLSPVTIELDFTPERSFIIIPWC